MSIVQLSIRIVYRLAIYRLANGKSMKGGIKRRVFVGERLNS